MVRKFLEDIFRRKLDVLHSARVVHTLYQQQKQGRYCDLKVLVEDQQYFVHRCVLAAASSQLDAQINGLDTIQLVGVTNYGFEHLLEILYSGKMAKVATVDSARFHQIVSAADALNAESVIEYCARERSDLMKVVLDQSSGAEKTSSDSAVPSSNITEVSVAETLAVDSPAGEVVMSNDRVGNEPSPRQPTMTNSEVFQPDQGGIKTDTSIVVPMEEHQEERVLDWEMKIKREPGEKQVLDLEQGLVAGIVTIGDDIESTSETTGPYSTPITSSELQTFSHSDEGHGSIADKIQSSRAAMFSGSLGLKRLRCGICKRLFSSQHMLKAHMKKHSAAAIKQFRCETCGMKFNFQMTLMNHVKLHEVKKYICKLCGRDFKLNRNLLAHVENVHSGYNTEPRESEYSFPQSLASISNAPLMSGSSRRKTQPVKIPAAADEKPAEPIVSGPSTELIEEQQPGTHSSNFTSNLKPELDEWKDALENIERGMDGKFSCPLCEKGFSRRWNLKCHILTHSENRVPRPRPKFPPKKVLPYHCSECGKAFGTASNLQKHTALIHPFSKTLFGFDGAGNSQLIKRIETPTQSGDPGAMCWCKICGRGFRRMRNLRSHMETHSGAGYECHICGRTFAQRDGLNGHLWIHGGLHGPKTHASNQETP